jgi:hypothetical protein
MSYIVHCDSCTLDREFSNWIDASWCATSHEREYPDHWASISELAES